MLEINNEQPVGNLREVESVSVIHYIVHEMSVAYECSVVLPTMSVLEVVAIDVVQFYQLLIVEFVHLSCVEVDSSWTETSGRGRVDIHHGDNVLR